MHIIYRITGLLMIIISVLLTTFVKLGDTHGIFGDNSADMWALVFGVWVLAIVANLIAIAEFIQTNRQQR